MRGEVSGYPPFSVKRAAKLGMKKHRESERLFLAEGAALFREANVAPRYVFEEPGDIERVSSLSNSSAPVGVFPFVDVPVERLLGGEEPSGVVVLLCGVQDPGNVGTVVRSAHAFGASVALSTGCADLYNPKTVRGTMGAIFHVPISREVEPTNFIGAARERGFTSVAAMPGGGESSRRMPGGKLVIVVGSEGSGVSDTVVEACDGRVSVPSAAPSLNAAVAASILLYEAHSRVLT